MSDYDYIELDVEKVFTYPSGAAIKVLLEGTAYSIPCATIHDDSDIWKGTTDGYTGMLKVRENIVLAKGMLGSGGVRGGIPLKRNKLPPAPELMSDEYRTRIAEALEASDPWVLANDEMPMLAHPVDTPIALFEGPNAETNVIFAAQAPAFVRDLLEENACLRTWVELATKRFNARRKKRS